MCFLNIKILKNIQSRLQGQLFGVTPQHSQSCSGDFAQTWSKVLGTQLRWRGINSVFGDLDSNTEDSRISLDSNQTWTLRLSGVQWLRLRLCHWRLQTWLRDEAWLRLEHWRLETWLGPRLWGLKTWVDWTLTLTPRPDLDRRLDSDSGCSHDYSTGVLIQIHAGLSKWVLLIHADTPSLPNHISA